MKKHNLFSIGSMALVSALALNFASCGDEPDDNGGGNTGYTSSDQIAASNLVAKFSFENSVEDAKGNITSGTTNNVTFVDGAKGKAYMGSADGYALFSNVGTAVTGIQSVTLSTWIKTSNHADGAESWFQLLNDSNWIGNMFVLQENGADGDSVRIKFNVNKWDAPAWKEQWMELGGDNRMVIGDGNWHHVVISYDAVSSKAAFYVDGKEMTMPEGITNRYGDDPTNGGAPLGPLKFKNATRFVFGCFKQHLPNGGTPDGWMKHYDGGLDEFRIYDKALAAADVKSLYDLEKAGK
jgi:hypothetical protein